MSRRPPPAAATSAEANKVKLKALVKLETNKSCADCKRNKHPRWASWNLGVFVCIRCSGIHRGMGTHISRVKSVDLDSWTDEQTQNMIRWGNGRANKYWESKLAEGHVPNESKIENFIRTKYDSKRWVMDGPMPDPSTLDDGSGADDDVPLSVVKEEIKRSASQRNGSMPQQQRRQEVDLFGDLEGSDPVPARPSTTEPAVSRAPAPPKAPAAPPKQTKPGDSLLGLDFFGAPQSSQPARPSSTGGGTPGVPGRADLKSSILSLYASKPAAPPQQPQQQQSNMNAFGGMQSPPLTSPTQHPQSNAQSFGGMNDAFSSLSFNQSPPAQQAKPSPFAGLTSPTGHSRQASSTSKPALSGGSFFDMKPAQPSKPMSPPSQPAPAPRKESFGNDWGDFSSAASPPPPPTGMKSPPATSSNMGDLFDMGSPPPQSKPAPAPAPPPKPAAQQPPPINYSAFNLSQPAAQPAKPAAPTSPPAQSSSSAFGALNNMDAWGSNNAWATPDPAPAPAPAPQQPPKQSSFSPPKPVPVQTSAFDSGWGDMTSPSASNSNAANTSSGFNVQQDDDFGGWSHASPVATTPGPKPSTGGGGLGGGTTDLFDNPW